jgi:hypothetical protein
MLWTDGVMLVAAQTPDGLARTLGLPRASVVVLADQPLAAMADELGSRPAFLIARVLAAGIEKATASPLDLLPKVVPDSTPEVAWKPIRDDEFVFVVKDGERRPFYAEALSALEGVVADRRTGPDGVPHWYLR